LIAACFIFRKPPIMASLPLLLYALPVSNILSPQQSAAPAYVVCGELQRSQERENGGAVPALLSEVGPGVYEHVGASHILDQLLV
jgi:hypothetical protein